MAKDADAFRTIGELSKDLGIAQHILRYWETRFPQLQPLKRAGNRRYYRTEDVLLVARINRLLNDEGYTIKGVQRILAGRAQERSARTAAAPVAATPAMQTAAPPAPTSHIPSELIKQLEQVRDELSEALNSQSA